MRRDLQRIGWNDRIEQTWREIHANDARADDSWKPGRVVAAAHDSAHVATASDTLLCRLTGKARAVATFPVAGDWVALRRLPAGEGVVDAVLPRTTELARRAITGQSGGAQKQVLAANVDTVFVVAALDGTRNFNLRKVERYLTLVWESGAIPVLVLNKVDLCPDVEEALAEARSVAIGVEVLASSAVGGEGLADLRPYCAVGQSVAFIGPSGVGKTSLINALLGRATLVVREARQDDMRGRHTTTAATLIALDEGAVVIDTPGLRTVQLYGEGDGLEASFDDVQRLAADCRYRDCAHRSEPGCAVQGAIASGDLPAERLASYLKLQRELAHLERRRDAGARRDARQEGRAFSRKVRKAVTRRVWSEQEDG